MEPPPESSATRTATTRTGTPCEQMRAYTGGGPDLVWYGAAGDRTKTSINAFGIVNEFRSV